jgi:Uma2 family endonuclease
MALTKLRLWTIEDYHRMVEAGILITSDRVELLEGQIIEVIPQLPPHASTTQPVARYLDRLLESVAYVRMQLPITLYPNSEPEPDIAVVRIDPNEYCDRHPGSDDILLIIEVADSTLLSDRRKKALIYSRAGILDYWTLDVNTTQIYQFREPRATGYNQEVVLTRDSLLVPLAFPTIAIAPQQLFR